MATTYYRSLLTPQNNTTATLTFTLPLTLKGVRVTGRIGALSNGSYYCSIGWRNGTSTTAPYYNTAVRAFVGTTATLDASSFSVQGTGGTPFSTCGYVAGSTAAANNFGTFEMTILGWDTGGSLTYSAQGGLHDTAGSLRWFSNGAYTQAPQTTLNYNLGGYYFNQSSWILVEGFS